MGISCIRGGSRVVFDAGHQWYLPQLAVHRLYLGVAVAAGRHSSHAHTFHREAVESVCMRAGSNGCDSENQRSGIEEQFPLKRGGRLRKCATNLSNLAEMPWFLWGFEHDLSEDLQFGDERQFSSTGLYVQLYFVKSLFSRKFEEFPGEQAYYEI